METTETASVPQSADARLSAPREALARPLYSRSPVSSPTMSMLPPLVTQIPIRSAAVRQSSASFPDTDVPPASTPALSSSLDYALVRDFAYPADHTLHYGPRPEAPASATTQGSGSMLKDDEYDERLVFDSKGLFSLQMPASKYADGPPYAEDEDLLSPIVTTTRHRRSKGSDYLGARVPRRFESLSPSDVADSPTVDADQGGVTLTEYSPSQSPSESYEEVADDDASRYSRHYQFSISSPDEEYAGKAVALFDFERENDNELPFAEGQVLYVSYRHGEGWLVAKDPKSGESGLVPEAYVRLLRDIEGGLSAIRGDDESPERDADTPTDAAGSPLAADKHYRPMVSSFSTSSKDLERYQFDEQTTPTAGTRPAFEALDGAGAEAAAAQSTETLDATTFGQPPAAGPGSAATTSTASAPSTGPVPDGV